MRRGSVVTTYTETVVIETCCECACSFGMESTFQKMRRADGKLFYCPAGHSQHYTETEAYRLRKEKEHLERRLANEAENRRIAWADAATARKEAQAERRRHGATKAKLTKTTKRAAATVCPVENCHRSFDTTRMQRHIEIKHPDYQPEEV